MNALSGDKIVKIKWLIVILRHQDNNVLDGSGLEFLIL